MGAGVSVTELKERLSNRRTAVMLFALNFKPRPVILNQIDYLCLFSGQFSLLLSP